MMQNKQQRDIAVLEKIVVYCDQLEETKKRFGNTYIALQNDPIYRNAAAMCILQIGELTKYLSEDFKSKFSRIPWTKIKNMGNIAAHYYGSFDMGILWSTMNEDIESLRDYCHECIAELSRE